MKHAVSARDLRRGDCIRFDGKVWQVSAQFFEPPDVMDLDLFCGDSSLNLHVGAGDLFELVAEIGSSSISSTTAREL